MFLFGRFWRKFFFTLWTAVGCLTWMCSQMNLQGTAFIEPFRTQRTTVGSIRKMRFHMQFQMLFQVTGWLKKLRAKRTAKRSLIRVHFQMWFHVRCPRECFVTNITYKWLLSSSYFCWPEKCTQKQAFMHKKKTICCCSNKNSVVARNNLKQFKTKILPQAGYN